MPCTYRKSGVVADHLVETSFELAFLFHTLTLDQTAAEPLELLASLNEQAAFWYACRDALAGIAGPDIDCGQRAKP